MFYSSYKEQDSNEHILPSEVKTSGETSSNDQWHVHGVFNPLLYSHLSVVLFEFHACYICMTSSPLAFSGL